MVSAGQVQQFEVGIDPQGLQGDLNLDCESPNPAVHCVVNPGSLTLKGSPSVVVVQVRANRSQRLRTRMVQAVMIKVKANFQGLTRTIDLPVQVER